MLSNPIIIIGAARSGTTFLSRLLSQHQKICYINEPKMIWGYKNNFNDDDVLVFENATRDIEKYIKLHFSKKLRNSTDMRLMEKTPANCLRIPFVLSIFPDAQLIHVVRDGRDVAVSAKNKWTNINVKGSPSSTSDYEGMKNLGLRRLRNRLFKSGIPVRDIAPYVIYSLFNIIHLRIYGHYRTWGPRIPGLSRLVSEESLINVCAIQWRECVNAVRRDTAQLSGRQYIEVRYEELAKSPELELQRIFSFLNLPPSNEVSQYADSHAKKDNQFLWKKRLNKDECAELESSIGETLRQFGYA